MHVYSQAIWFTRCHSCEVQSLTRGCAECVTGGLFVRFTFLHSYSFPMASFCPSSALRIHPASVLVKRQHQWYPPSNQRLDGRLLRNAGFGTHEACHGFCSPHIPYISSCAMYSVVQLCQCSLVQLAVIACTLHTWSEKDLISVELEA